MTEKKTNRLTDTQKFQLRDWVLDRQKEGAIYDDLQAFLDAAKGIFTFPLTVENMRSIQESSGINLLKRKRKELVDYAELVEKVRALEERFNKWEAEWMTPTKSLFPMPDICREVR